MLKYFYGTMFAGKTLHLIQAKEIYDRKHINAVVLKKDTDTRESHDSEGWSVIASRFNPNKTTGCFYFNDLKKDIVRFVNKNDVFIIDEAQFLTADEVLLLKDLSVNGSKDVICYRLKTDVNSNLFEASAALLSHADNIAEIPMLCQDGQCLEKATHHARYVNGIRDTDGNPVKI